jgi:hypothetical protein
MTRAACLFIIATFAAACGDSTGPIERPIEMNGSDLQLEWAIERNQELACGGDEVAGGGISGEADLSPFGNVTIGMTAAWDIGARNADPTQAEFSPEGPAGGPFAPIFGPAGHPYQFNFNPASGECGGGPVATGELVLTTEDGAEIRAVVTGGETHRLDFVMEGDGVELFAIVSIVGGSGRYRDATGSLVLHTISRFDFDAMQFVVDLAEVLPGGTVTF